MTIMDDHNSPAVISNKLSKKIARKIKKHEHMVSKQTNITCTSTPTKNLALCNVGLVNGISEDSIIEHFQKYGSIQKIILLPEKSCSFIQYNDVNSAMAAYENANGVLPIAQDNKPVYLSFVEQLPYMLYKKSYNVFPPGLVLLQDFISEEEEKLLLLSEDEFLRSPKQDMKHRRVKHYGYEFCYDVNNVNKQKPLPHSVPETCHYLFKRLNSMYVEFSTFSPDQMTINHYLPGQGIPHHIDTHSAFEDPIVSLSLGSSVVMDFKHNDGTHLSVLLPQRSLLIMSGESRYSWTHGIVPKKFDIIHGDNGYNVLERKTRISFTFRKVRVGSCNCEYKSNCDSYMAQSEKNIQNCAAIELEKRHVHNVYEEIANHFSDTRQKLWPNVEHFVESLEVGSLVVDVGCGNGKYLGSGVGTYNLGCDMSTKLTELCGCRGYQVFVCNSLNIPIKDNSVDAVISIAVIHHIANEERRLQAINEIVRILKVSGEALIYVWAKNQLKDGQKTSYIKQNRKNRTSKHTNENVSNEVVEVITGIELPVHTNRSDFKHMDLLVPWKLKNAFKPEQVNNTLLRYYHVFEEGELENLCAVVDGIDIISAYYDEGNWCVKIKKTK